MRIRNVNTVLNEELLRLLPLLDETHQKALLLQWGTLTIRERREVLRLLRPLQNGTIEPDLIVLSKLAAYFDCGVFDLVRYVRSDEPPS